MSLSPYQVPKAWKQKHTLPHGEDVLVSDDTGAAIERLLFPTGFGIVDLSVRLPVRHGDFIRSNPNDQSVFVVKL